MQKCPKCYSVEQQNKAGQTVSGSQRYRCMFCGSKYTPEKKQHGYDANAPYTVALIKLEEGPMLTAQLTDVDNNAIQIGMPVEMVTRKMRNDGDERGLIVYGYKFRPAVAA